jgi:peptide/nickel transport system substrate-binding protein
MFSHRYRFVLLVLVLGLIASLIPATFAQDMTYNESPMLAERVAAGELPPVAERLPLEPQVTTPFNETGTYGGELRVGFTGGDPFWGGIYSINGWERVAAWKTDFSGVEPGIVAGWDISEDVTEYTFHLREGMKWSDGQPYTTEDWRFYIEDILFNEELTPGNPGGSSNGWLPADGAEDFQIEVIDDYTIKFTFAQPNGTLLLQLAQWQGSHFSSRPAHFMKQFHADYNPDIDSLVAAEDGVEDWIGLFNKYANQSAEVNIFPQNPDMLEFPEKPSLSPWILVEEMGTGTTLRMERNPYYWKVDTEGNQLPYIDGFVGTQYQDDESRTFAMLNGDLDYIKDPGGTNRILYFDAVAEGRPLAINTPINDAGTTNTVQLNLNVEDPVLQEIFRNKDFRIGLSHAINREEIIEIVHFGQGVPSQVGPLEGSPLYNEQLAYQYTEYNVDLANEALDKVAPEKDADGYRLCPDGERLSLVISIPNDYSYTTTYTQVGELVAGYWNAVGVEAIVNSMPGEQWETNFLANNVDAVIFTGEGGAGLNSILDPRYVVPGEYHGLWGNGFHAFRTNNPDASVKLEMEGVFAEQRARYENVLIQPSQEAQIEAMREVLQVAADEFWVIGISRPGPDYQPYSSRLGNLPEEWVKGWIEGIEKIIRPEQWYIMS